MPQRPFDVAGHRLRLLTADRYERGHYTTCERRACRAYLEGHQRADAEPAGGRAARIFGAVEALCETLAPHSC
ncbi:MAG: hypothetical protein ACJ8CR_30290 [Roseiflexaceae bacterium]